MKVLAVLAATIGAVAASDFPSWHLYCGSSVSNGSPIKISMLDTALQPTNKFSLLNYSARAALLSTLALWIQIQSPAAPPWALPTTTATFKMTAILHCTVLPSRPRNSARLAQRSILLKADSAQLPDNGNTTRSITTLKGSNCVRAD